MDPYIIGYIVLLVLQWIFVPTRMFVRAVLVRKFGADDVATLITLILSTAYDALCLAIISLSHDKPISPDDPNVRPILMMTMSSILIYLVASTMFKIALGLLLLRVLVKRWQVYTTYGLMMFSAGFGLVCFFVDLFNCGSPSSFDPNVIEGKCYTPTTIKGFGYTQAILDGLIDLAMGALPVFLLKDADMSFRNKLSVGFVLSLGSLGVIVTFVRTGFVHDLAHTGVDFYVHFRPLAILSALELAVGLICVSISTYKPIVWYFFGKTEYYYYDTSHAETQSASRPRLLGEDEQTNWLSLPDMRPFDTSTMSKSDGTTNDKNDAVMTLDSLANAKVVAEDVSSKSNGSTPTFEHEREHSAETRF